MKFVEAMDYLRFIPRYEQRTPNGLEVKWKDQQGNIIAEGSSTNQGSIVIINNHEFKRTEAVVLLRFGLKQVTS
jgi:hypothetical protein